MDRLASRLALPALVAGALASAGAQTLQTLHVRSFNLTADRSSIRVGEAFHLTLAAHVDEAILELDDVTLPDLSGFDVLGDERRCSSNGRGSDCTETLTLAATTPGERAIGPVTMDAVDARNRKASRFATNTVTVRVAGVSVVESTASSLLAALFGALRAFVILALVTIAGLALLWGFRRARPSGPPAPPVLSPAPAFERSPQPDDPDARLKALVDELEREPIRPRVLALREALRARFGARDAETLRDLLARGAGNGAYPPLALAAVERAAFCEDAFVADAIREALPFLKG